MNALSELPLHDLFESHYLPAKLATRSPQTIYQYRLTLGDFAEFLGRAPLATDLTDANASRFVGWMHHTRQLAVCTANGRRDYLLAMWNWLARKRAVAEFPDVARLTVPETEPDAWSVEQMSRLFAAAEQGSRPLRGIPGALWWPAFLHTAFESGERSGALLHYRWEYYDPDAQLFRVPGQIRKGRKSLTFEVRDHVAARLLQLREHYDGPMAFPGYDKPRRAAREAGWYERRTYFLHYRQVLVRAGLPAGRRHQLQKLRRTYSTYIDRAGGDATKACRHSSRDITEKHYIDRAISRGERWCDMLPRIEGSD